VRFSGRFVGLWPYVLRWHPVPDWLLFRVHVQGGYERCKKAGGLVLQNSSEARGLALAAANEYVQMLGVRPSISDQRTN